MTLVSDSNIAKAKSSAFFQESSKFLNRKDQLALLDAQLGLLSKKPKHFEVCEVIGLGGMGKSRLLDELRKHAKEPGRRIDHVAFVSLETESSATEVGALLALREDLEVDCHLFDAALVRYWSALGQPFSLERSSRVSRSLAVKAVETGGALASVPMPISFAVGAWQTMRTNSLIRGRYKRFEFQEIDDLRAEPRVIRERLPRYLAMDLRRALVAANQRLIVFYDSYDRQDPETVAAGAPWLREFISRLGRGVHVISSREPLGWRKAAWGKGVRVKVGRLSREESQTMIRARLGKLPEPVEERLLAMSHGTPFFIESAINVYIDLAREKPEVESKDLPSTSEDAVAVLLDHRRTPQRALATALATVQAFDRGLYQQMADVLCVELAILHFRDFLDSFLVEGLSGELHKAHDLLTEIVRESQADEPVRRVALETATTHLLERCRQDGRREHETVLAILRGLLEGWSSVRDMPRRSVEALIDIAYVLYDAGFSNELKSIASDGSAKRTGSKPKHSIAIVADFLDALSTRRIAGVDPAIGKFNALQPVRRRLGRHGQSVKLELAYLRELGGNYFRARKEFRNLSTQAEPFDPTDRTHVRARLYHADMLIMDGNFRAGSELLEETYEEIGYREIVNWGELVRHRGHAYRFSFCLEKAESLYRLALRKISEAPGLKAKLYTNLVETCCWRESDRALGEAEEAIRLNRGNGNQIELAKCYAAMGIAFARLAQFDEAAAAVREAKALAKVTGYPAGAAFALQAEAVAKGSAGNGRGLSAAMERLLQQTRELGTYDHLRVAPLMLSGDHDAVIGASAEVEWFEPEDLQNRLGRYLRI